MHASHDLAAGLSNLFQAVLRASWQGSLAIALVLAIRRLLGNRMPARWHYLLWFLVLARLLVPVAVLPPNPVSLENIPVFTRPFARSPMLPQSHVAPPSKIVPLDVRATASPIIPGPLPRPVVTQFFSGTARTTWTCLASFWLGGLIIFCTWLAACVIRLHRKVRRETSPARPEILAVWQTCCHRWLHRSPPRLLAAAWLTSPALVGWWRPTLVIPQPAPTDFSTQDWEHVFAHEIAHLRWRDHWSQPLLLVAGCVHWFNPVVWLGLRRLQADREIAADEWVLQHLQNDCALAYGETLFKTLANRPASLAFQPGLVGLGEDGAQMKQRLRRIADFLPGPRRLGSLAGLTVLLVLATVVLGQGPASPAPSPAASPAKSTEKSSASPTPSVQDLFQAAQRFQTEVWDAARAGDSQRLQKLLDASYAPPAKLDKQTAIQMLGRTLQDQDLSAFTTLHDALLKTIYGSDWQIREDQLAILVKAGRTDFLEVLFARRLDPARLTALASLADARTAEWIGRRAAEVARQRADIEALGHAARDNDLSTLRRLLDAGVDVNAVDNERNTALIEAVFQDRLDAARLLLERGAEVDKVRYPGWDYTPLTFAKSVSMAQLLKDHGANIHATLFGRPTSILTYVAMFQSADMVTWFLRQGLDPRMIGDNDQNLLFGVGDPETAKLLMDLGVDPNRLNEFGMPPISQARDAATAQALIDGGARLDGFKQPLVPEMIFRGGGDALAPVLKAGPAPDFETIQQWLINAAHANNQAAAKALLAHGAKPNEPGTWSGSLKELPLQVCCIFGGVETTRVLLEAGADPNGGKTSGWLLHIAMHNRHQEVAKLLRAAGAKGVSDLAFALATGDANQTKALLASAPAFRNDVTFWDDVLPTAALLGKEEVLRAALARGVPVEPKAFGQGIDAYSAAANEGQHEALAVLLATRPPDAEPEDLRPALWWAVWNCHPYDNQRTAEHFERCVEMLLAAHAPITGYQDTHNLMAAAVYTRNPGGNPRVMEMLAQAGVDPNPYRTEGNQPPAYLLDDVQKACATGNCSTPVAETLIKLVQLSKTQPAETPPPPAPSASLPPPTPVPTEATLPRLGVSSTGHVSMADGTPLGSQPITARLYSARPGGWSIDTEPVENGTFPVRVDADTTSATLAVEQPGGAPTFLGPFDAASLSRLADAQIKLERGYTAAVHVVDTLDRPIAGARLRPYYPGPPTISALEVVTDADGIARLEHLGQAPLNIRVLADGYRGAEVVNLRLDPVKPYRWMLQPTPPLPGIVTAADTGQPVAGAVVKLGGVRGPYDEDHYDPKQAPVLTTTDAQGRFALKSLRPDSRYYLFVEAPGYGGVYLHGIQLAQPKLEVLLGPELRVRGKLVHIPATAIYQGKTHLQFSQTFHIGQNSSGSAGNSVELEPVNGEAAFNVGLFYRVSGEPPDSTNPPPWDHQTVTLYVGARGRAYFRPEQLPIANFIFDLAHSPASDGLTVKDDSKDSEK